MAFGARLFIVTGLPGLNGSASLAYANFLAALFIFSDCAHSLPEFSLICLNFCIDFRA